MAADEPVTGHMVVGLADEMKAIYGIMPAANRVIFPAVALIGLGYILWSTVFGSGLGGLRWPLLMLGILLVCFVLFLPVLRTLTYLRSSAEQRQLHVAVDAERIEKRSGTGLSVAVPWREVRWCRENELGFAFGLKPMGVLWLPKRAFAPAAVASIRGFVGTKVAGAKLREEA